MLLSDLKFKCHRTHPAQRRHCATLSPVPGSLHHDLSTSNIPSEIMSDGIRLYFKHHCNQPCPLFDHLRLQEPSSQQYPPVVWNAMLALSLRHSNHPLLSPINKRRGFLKMISRRAWDLLAEAYHHFEFDDCYFQALCLFAQVDYAEGRSDRARIQIALGLRLAQARGMLSKTNYEDSTRPNRIQHQEIVWSLFILDRIFIGRCISSTIIPDTLYSLPMYLGGPAYPGHFGEINEANNSRSVSRNSDIVNSYIQMLGIWEVVILYVNESLTAHSKPFWHHDSTRAKILTRLLELEIRECIVSIHKYAN